MLKLNNLPQGRLLHPADGNAPHHRAGRHVLHRPAAARHVSKTIYGN